MTIDIRDMAPEAAWQKIDTRLEDLQEGDVFQMVGNNSELHLQLKERFTAAGKDIREVILQDEWVLSFIV